jgi:hypothetical protein
VGYPDKREQTLAGGPNRSDNPVVH